MFDLSHEVQQQACASKPVQSKKDLFINLRMEDLVEPTTLVDIHDALHESFGNRARKVNLKVGEKVYVNDNMRIAQEIFLTWEFLKKVVARSRN